MDRQAAHHSVGMEALINGDTPPSVATILRYATLLGRMCQLGWSYYQPWLSPPVCPSVRSLPSRLGIPTETGTQCILAARCHHSCSRGLFCCPFGSRCVASQKNLLPEVRGSLTLTSSTTCPSRYCIVLLPPHFPRLSDGAEWDLFSIYWAQQPRI